MGIPIRITTSATSVRRRVVFTCVRCAARADAEVLAFGQGSQTFLNPDGAAVARAQRDAEREVGRTIAAARCPKCGERAPNAFRRYVMQYVWLTVLITALGFVIGYALLFLRGENEHALTFALVMTGICFLIGFLTSLFVCRSRWTSIDRRVTWL
jgi:hypothetical protein